ncbi:hypothetical protein C0J52_05548 [Blattella germanica]|nr:hypothetical protein C0J52_05548 [Blattella germanica]
MFCFKLDKTATETHGMLEQLYGVKTVSKKCEFQWFKHFRDEKEGVEDEPNSVQPPTSITSDVERVLQMIVADSPDFVLFSRPN